MAKDEELKERPEEEQDTQEHDFCITHNLDDGQIIALRRNMQKHFSLMPEEERVIIKMVNKKGDPGLYFRATQARADRILERLQGHAEDWAYKGANFRLETIEEPPAGLLSDDDIKEIEEKVSASYKEELGRLYVQIGSLTSQLDGAREDVSGLEERCTALQAYAEREKEASERLAREIGQINSVYITLTQGNLIEVMMEVLKARKDILETLELMMDELQTAGLDIEFIAKPPSSAEKYAQEKTRKIFGIDYQSMMSSLDIGTAETWQKCKLYESEDEINEAKKKCEALQDLVAKADPSIKDLVVKGLSEHIEKFSKTLRVYESKLENWKKAREIYTEFQRNLESGRQELAKAKGLQGVLADVKQKKYIVLAVPEVDSATLYAFSNTGIGFESLKTAIGAHARVLSEELQSGLMMLKIGCKNGDWKPTDCLLAIRETYNSQETEAGKLGNKLGLIIQL